MRLGRVGGTCRFTAWHMQPCSTPSASTFDRASRTYSRVTCVWDRVELKVSIGRTPFIATVKCHRFVPLRHPAGNSPSHRPCRVLSASPPSSGGIVNPLRETHMLFSKLLALATLFPKRRHAESWAPGPAVAGYESPMENETIAAPHGKGVAGRGGLSTCGSTSTFPSSVGFFGQRATRAGLPSCISTLMLLGSSRGRPLRSSTGSSAGSSSVISGVVSKTGAMDWLVNSGFAVGLMARVSVVVW